MESFLLPKSLIDYPSSDSILSQKPIRSVIITGITGQDGLYLTAFLLLDPNLPFQYEVHGVVRKNSAGLPILERLREHVIARTKREQSALKFHFGDVTDAHFMNGIIKDI